MVRVKNLSKSIRIYTVPKQGLWSLGILVNLFPYFPLCVPFKASFSQPSCHLRRLRRRKIRWQLRLLTCHVYLKIVMINIDSFDDESDKWLLIIKLILWVCLIYICILCIYIYVPPNMMINSDSSTFCRTNVTRQVGLYTMFRHIRILEIHATMWAPPVMFVGL